MCEWAQRDKKNGLYKLQAGIVVFSCILVLLWRRKSSHIQGWPFELEYTFYIMSSQESNMKLALPLTKDM